MRNKIFSLEEANRLIPYLEETLSTLSTLGREVTGLRREIEVLNAIADSGATLGNPDVRSLRGKEQAYTEALERFKISLTEVSRHGCILRDLELGLVDFYTMSHDRIVCLCWRRGEPAIAHWHPIDEGFSGRRPLKDLS